MAKRKKQKYEVGYKKPPVQTRFRRGQSGNPAGRPKKGVLTFPQAIKTELLRQIRILEGGKPLSIAMIQAIAKQCTNKAASGDLKAVALIMNALCESGSVRNDNQSPIVQELRNIHAKHEAVSSSAGSESTDSGSAATLISDVKDGNDNGA